MQFQTQLQMLRFDNGGEYVKLNIKNFLSDNDLIHQTICPDIPQQKGAAEMKNCILLKITLALLFESHVPTNFWPELIATASYLTNCLPTKSINFQTPLHTL